MYGVDMSLKVSFSTEHCMAYIALVRLKLQMNIVNVVLEGVFCSQDPFTMFALIT